MPTQENKMEGRGGQTQVSESNPPGAYEQKYALGRGKAGRFWPPKSGGGVYIGDKGGTLPAGLHLGFLR